MVETSIEMVSCVCVKLINRHHDWFFFFLCFQRTTAKYKTHGNHLVIPISFEFALAHIFAHHFQNMYHMNAKLCSVMRRQCYCFRLSGCAGPCQYVHVLYARYSIKYASSYLLLWTRLHLNRMWAHEMRFVST